MSGRCYDCGQDFKSYFSGEKGCKSCGFEFCKKCINKKIVIPKLDDKPHSVCDKCYKQLTSGKKAPKPKAGSPPKAFVKRMEALEKREAKQLPCSSNGTPTSKNQNKHYSGMEKEDADLMRRLDQLKADKEKNVKIPDEKEIAQRLAGLRSGRPEPPSEQDMRDRLAALQGKTSTQAAEAAKPQYLGPDRRNNEEQVVDLMDELFNENRIEIRQQGKENQTADNSLVPTLSDKSATNNKLAKAGEVDIEAINELIAKSAKELQLDAEIAIESLKQDEELMSRLREIKKDKKSKKETGCKDKEERGPAEMGDSDVDSEDDDKMASQLIKQYLEEAKLEEITNSTPSQCQTTDSTTSQVQTNQSDAPAGHVPGIYKPACEEPEEDGWCCICNEDAKIRCHDCEDDLYCTHCFRKGHKSADMKDHEYERYPKNKR